MIPVSVRTAGAILIALAAAGLSRVVRQRFLIRVEELLGWQMVLSRLESEVRWQARALPDALERCRHRLPRGVDECLETFIRAAREREESTEVLWQEALAGATRLSPEDLAILADLGPVLGRYSRQEQSQHLSLCRERLMQAERAARLERDSQGRALPALVALAGLAVAVVVA